MKIPRLPGRDLGAFGMEEGTCIYDTDNPEAYVIGEATEIGTDTRVRES